MEARVASGVFFAANRESSLSGAATITYAVTYTSQGGGFNSSTGIFTTPVAGFYSFHFIGYLSGGLTTTGTVALKSNDIIIGKASSLVGVLPSHVSFSTVLKLSSGETVSMALINGVLTDSATDKRTHFSGALIERA